MARTAPDEIAGRAVRAFQEIYRHAAMVQSPRVLLGTPAIRRLAAATGASDLPPSRTDHMVGFLFPLGAKRAMDYAGFFAELYPALAQLKYEQATLFGRCQTQAARRDWSALAEHLHCLTDVEDRFTETLLSP